MGKTALRLRFLTVLVLWVVTGLVSGCISTSTKTIVPPAQTPSPLKSATKAELIAQYDRLANSITSLNMTVTIQLTAGSTYTGTIEQYHEVNGFILAQKPSQVRVIGQVPVVGKNIFDMESDGEMFRIFIPSKNQFLVGPAGLERPSSKPIENLRPQHLLDAVFWQPIASGAPVLFEETAAAQAGFYVLTVIRVPGAKGDATGSDSRDWEIDRKIWFDRTELGLVRIDTFEAGGKTAAMTRYSGWDTFGAVRYPKQILLDRPQNDYQLQLAILKVAANEEIAPDRFDLPQPPGTELIRVGEEAEEK
jgi:hypothetical protein